MRSKGETTSPLNFVSKLHARAAGFFRQEDEAQTTDGHDFASRFVTLLALAGLFVPFYLIEFTVSGHPTAAFALLVTCSIFAGSALVYKTTGRQGTARDLFLTGLVAFLVWEADFFGTVYSPGTVWFGVLPVTAILLGSLRASVVWLIIAIAGIAGTYMLTSERGAVDLVTSDRYTVLYTVSACGMLFATFLFVVIVDSGRAEAHSRLELASAMHRRQAERDELTGLFNRRALEGVLDFVMVKTEHDAAAIFCDLDGFKDVNDTYGHHIGDRLIQKIGASLSRICERHAAVPARLGGDEFAIVVPGPGAMERASAIGNEMLDLVAAPLELNGRSAVVGISMGVAIASSGIDSAELMRRADIALYEAKNSGRMRVCHYRCELDSARARRRSLALKLEKALADSAIDVHYQPIVCAKSFQVTGVEALARWTTDTGEAVSPEEFVPIAEESGLIDKLGLAVLERACEDAAFWPSLDVAVNVSPLQFRSATLVEDISSVLTRTGMEPGRLELEVTEGYLIEHRERAQPIIAALRAKGIRIALDDFGTGYASIAYLRQYQFDRLKIDRSLARHIVDDDASRSIVQAISILAKSLSMKLTGEGAETEETARLFFLAGCDRLQGYWFGKPQPAEQIALLLGSDGATGTGTRLGRIS